ncbi:MAG TPA: YfbM family protein [Microthrixaceae bacterium]|nr:YfbM family protein [Microthrixaceae bacterium]
MSMIMQWDSADAATAENVRSMDVEAFIQWLEDSDGRISFDVDKAWHAVHFTLTGEEWNPIGPFGEVVLGGEPFGEEIGYGPARWLSPEAVANAARELVNLSPDEFAGRLDLSSMFDNNIYPEIWNRDPVDEQLVEYVVAGYTEIRDRFTEAAASGQGFVISLQ